MSNFVFLGANAISWAMLAGLPRIELITEDNANLHYLFVEEFRFVTFYVSHKVAPKQASGIYFNRVPWVRLH